MIEMDNLLVEKPRGDCDAPGRKKSASLQLPRYLVSRNNMHAIRGMLIIENVNEQYEITVIMTVRYLHGHIPL